MLEALLGGGLGALARLAPEVLKFFDRKGERSHELSLGEQQQALIALQGKTQMAQIDATTNAAQFTQAVQALQAAYSTLKSGVAWADALTATVRPVVTYAFSVGYLYFKLSTGTWTNVDTGIYAGLLNFWFMGRVFDKAAK